MSTAATKKGVDTAVSSTSSGKPPHDEHTTACERNPQRERRQPGQTSQHRSTHPHQQSETRAETAVSSNSSGNHRPSNAQRRVPASRKESGHSYARHRSGARVYHSITQTIYEKLREQIQRYAATLVYSGVCKQLVSREHALPCQAQAYPSTLAELTAQRIPNGVRSNSSTQQRVHAIRREKNRRSCASQRSIVQLKHQAAREQIQPCSST